MKSFTITIKDEQGNVVDTMQVKEKDFKTGSRGFYGMAKLEIDGKRYQTQMQMVEIGSKNQ